MTLCSSFLAPSVGTIPQRVPGTLQHLLVRVAFAKRLQQGGIYLVPQPTALIDFDLHTVNEEE